LAVDHELQNVQANARFFNAAAAGNLPSVSWVMPTTNKGEHPPDYIGNGQGVRLDPAAHPAVGPRS
jgi:phospholipase C